MQFTESERKRFERYARLIAAMWLNVREGQMVVIQGEPVHRPLMLAVERECYDLGARVVHFDITDRASRRTRILRGAEAIKQGEPHIHDLYEKLLAEKGARLSITGEENPDEFAGLDPGLVSYQETVHREDRAAYFERGAPNDVFNWCVVAGATQAWADKIFPGRFPGEALSELWDQIFKVCHVDAPDPILAWQEVGAMLDRRRKKLDELELDELHFVGPETDLRVGLTPLARFHGGQKEAQNGVRFWANAPTYEVFTTPDFRRTEGYVRVTRPIRVSGGLITGLKLHFRRGELADFSATSGSEIFFAMLATDEGAKRLGEIALVGIDSPIHKSGLNFERILLDENADSHGAIGNAYSKCLVGGTTMSKEALLEHGCNRSSVHTDLMISDENVDVIGTRRRGGKVPLLTKGVWQI